VKRSFLLFHVEIDIVPFIVFAPQVTERAGDVLFVDEAGQMV
jgi:hypothetical protein